MYSYIAKVTDKINNGSGIINSIRVGVFRVEDDHEEQVGEYIRNYSAFSHTFYHFKKDGKDYALYSPHYTATMVMELPSCREIGGEEPNAWGFCPIDYYVPSYIVREHEFDDNKGEHHIFQHRHNEPSASLLVPHVDKYDHSRPLSPLLYYPFGFVAGCVWGDDSSTKIQYLDLSEVDKGIIKRDNRFGYIEMPDALSLKQAIDLYSFMYDPDEEDAYEVTIAIQKRFDIRTGKMLN